MYEADAKYDDRWLCINAQNKGGSPIQDIDSFLNSQLKETISSIHMTIPSSPIIKGSHAGLIEGEVVVYPNPATSQITFEYKCKTEGNLIIYNSIGQEVLATPLQNGKISLNLLTNHMSQGVYTYKCEFEGCESKFGKFSIVR